MLAVFSPDGRYLITGGWERELICWDAQKMERAFNIGLNSYALQFRSDGRQCAVVTRPGPTVHLHSFETPAGHREFAEDLGPHVQQAFFSPDGRWLAASGQKRLGVWDLASGGPGALTEQGAESHLFFTPDSSELFGSYDRECFRLRILRGTNVALPPQLQPLPLHKPDGFTSLCLSSNLVVWTSTKGSRIVSLGSKPR